MACSQCQEGTFASSNRVVEFRPSTTCLKQAWHILHRSEKTNSSFLPLARRTDDRGVIMLALPPPPFPQIVSETPKKFFLTPRGGVACLLPPAVSPLPLLPRRKEGRGRTIFRSPLPLRDGEGFARDVFVW